MEIIYHPQRLPEFSGNPLIEALPAKTGDKDVLVSLRERPEINDEIRTFPDFDRQDFLIRLKMLREPLFDYLDCFRMIERAIKFGYSSRNPLSATTMQYLHHIDYDSLPVKPISGGFQSEGSAMTVIGESGVGKSKMLEQILPYFQQLIRHTTYGDHKFVLEQVVWVKVSCPSNASLSILCRSILKELDRAIGRPLTKHEYFEESLLEQVEIHLRNSFVGILVIDEVQELSLANSKDVEQFLAFTFHLINRSGIPILFCGNPRLVIYCDKHFALLDELNLLVISM